MRKKPKLSKNVGKDIVLCKTTNRIVSRRTTSLLLEQSVPFSKTYHRVPLFLRHNYNGADIIYVFSINRTQYSHARRVLSLLEEHDYNRLSLNVI
ncbi:hypothetical protein SAMN02910298_02018 [Pseudobutyrivibrio sp. YE44]|uniref:hypothetical protein n=1 Tax=Pseudobutyrivibrio sp. YE44 TaxID=1520802 RepID=UPI000890EAF2|nr:hypothetical protein [Pseudobutyrivibrio sp. YE44]SDB40915.1 hypothetical protein SAMN02910298_02018 [Pseudobutyrivibrio sp. YE44]